MLGRVTRLLLDKRMTLPVVLVLGLLPCTQAAAQSVRERLPQEFQLARAGLVRHWFSLANIDPLRNRVGVVTLLDGRLYVQTTGGTIQALDGETGRRLWESQVGSPTQDVIPVTANSTSLFVVNATNLYVLDKQTGAHSWEATLQHTPSASATASATCPSAMWPQRARRNWGSTRRTKSSNRSTSASRWSISPPLTDSDAIRATGVRDSSRVRRVKAVTDRRATERELLRWAETLSATARTGLGFTNNLYERERFEEVLDRKSVV